MAFLDAINPQTLLERVRPVLGGRTRAAIIVGGAVAATLVVLAALWLWGSSYAVLYAGLSGEEGGRAIAELQKLNIPYRITEGGRVIEVPASDVGRARLQLAARGVVKHDSDEWAILDNESLGVSPFVEQVHYVRGIEAALSRTVGEVDGVVSAKVTLALPKQTDFLARFAKAERFGSGAAAARHDADRRAGHRHRRSCRVQRAGACRATTSPSSTRAARCSIPTATASRCRRRSSSS